MSLRRIQFVRNVPVDLDSLPTSARGQCLQLDIGPGAVPVVAAGQFVIGGDERVWCIPAGRVVQFSADVAERYLQAGHAIPYDSHTGLGTFNTTEPEERKGTV